MNIVESQRLNFLRVEKEDFAFFLEYLSDPELTRFLPLEKPYPKAKVVEYLDNRIKHWNKHQFGTYLLKLKSTGEIIGYCGLEYVRDTKYIDIRYSIVKNQWGKGYAKEAAKKCIEHGFMELNLNVIYGAAVPENTPSIMVLEKLGMKRITHVNFYDDVVWYYQIKSSQHNQSRDQD
jgi:ribosomal-protein-alanine N-acetyltransferase